MFLKLEVLGNLKLNVFYPKQLSCISDLIYLQMVKETFHVNSVSSNEVMKLLSKIVPNYFNHFLFYLHNVAQNNDISAIAYELGLKVRGIH